MTKQAPAADWCPEPRAKPGLMYCDLPQRLLRDCGPLRPWMRWRSGAIG